ncbi:hypothetical protein CC85DRAFT_56106 [Cutaneotrichosporon oleaginosum]|uniref:Uncharacterized protein n=1 Tax=Cutaneotrichosporon oleaginosum TaxID=879819 RepID=A0A0J0XYM0_9TREE|nr:uncharacterized protein CC85DRAFT_56106 [Cutaneotrichosporon oleaginosum]KLT46150.1 hypothetical protein CC85DRAFT_56106 [Cutaneotrichosporon oleaginosum]TXT10160.1 hypothetical protein COLE_04094 [Cutaneotrichosporon oleaginosum]
MLCSVPSHPPLQSHLHNIVQQQSSRQAHSSPSPPRPPRTPATQHMPSSPASESPRATTPPRRASRRKARLPQQPAALVNASDAQDITDAGGSTDDDVLELLRSPPTHTPGMLHLSKAALDAAKKDVPKHLPRQKPVRRDGARGQDALASTPPDPRRRRKVVEGARSATEVGKVAVAPKSSADGSTGIGTDLPVSSDLHSGLHVQAEASNSMDLAALSQSLPASFFAEAQQGTKDAQVGDAPQRASPVYELPPNVSECVVLP